MTDNDLERFVKALALISLLPGIQDLNEAQIELYFRFLKDLHIDDVEKAICEVIKRKKITTFPLIGEIREKVELSIDDEVDGAALEAWRRVSYLSKSSSYPSKSKLIEDAVKMAFGSWQEFGQLDTFYENRDRQHFIKCYKLLVLRSLKKDRKAQLEEKLDLTGLSDQNEEK